MRSLSFEGFTGLMINVKNKTLAIKYYQSLKIYSFNDNNLNFGITSLSLIQSGEVSSCVLMKLDARKHFPLQKCRRSVRSYTVFVAAEMW